MVDTDITLDKSANHPTTDAATAGGARTTTQITNAATGEWLTRLVAAMTGDLDTDAEQQWQEAYLRNRHVADSLADFGIYVDNLLAIPAASGLMKGQSSSASDNSTKELRFWIDVAGVLVLGDDEVVTMNGVTLVTGAQTAVRCFRVGLFTASTGALATAAGVIDIYCGAELIGHIPQGESWATSEYRFAAAAANGDSATFTNRRTQPGGLTWTRPNTEATRIPGTGQTLAPETHRAIYAEQTLQAGMTAEPTIKLCLAWAGEDTGS